MTLLGGVLIVLGSFLPWLTATAPFVGTISRNGMEGGDGVITLILGVVTILIGVTQLTGTNLPTLLQRSPIVTGAIAGIVAVTNYLNVQQRIEDVREESELIAASVGAGIWTLVVGAVLAIVGGVLVRKLPNTSAALCWVAVGHGLSFSQTVAVKTMTLRSPVLSSVMRSMCNSARRPSSVSRQRFMLARRSLG
jgi:hypothetical protein